MVTATTVAKYGATHLKTSPPPEGRRPCKRPRPRAAFPPHSGRCDSHHRGGVARRQGQTFAARLRTSQQRGWNGKGGGAAAPVCRMQYSSCTGGHDRAGAAPDAPDSARAQRAVAADARTGGACKTRAPPPKPPPVSSERPQRRGGNDAVSARNRDGHRGGLDVAGWPAGLRRFRRAGGRAAAQSGRTAAARMVHRSGDTSGGAGRAATGRPARVPRVDMDHTPRTMTMTFAFSLPSSLSVGARAHHRPL